MNKFKDMIQGLFTSNALPDDWAKKSLKETPLMALDLELTSLDTNAAKITSIGWICGNDHQCHLASANHYVIRATGSLQQSPAIHGLTHEKIKQGQDVSEVIDTLVPMLSSHILVLHHARLDMAVIKRLADALCLHLPKLWIIDTLVLCKYLLEKSQQMIGRDSLTLTNCRKRYSLPDINAHNALDDAMATMELWYACQSAMKIRSNESLKALMHTGALKPYQMDAA